MIYYLESAIKDLLKEKFGVLHDGYLADMSKEFVEELDDVFSEAFDVRFLPVDNCTTQPAYRWMFGRRELADAWAGTHENKHHISIAMVLVEK